MGSCRLVVSPRALGGRVGSGVSLLLYLQAGPTWGSKWLLRGLGKGRDVRAGGPRMILF